MIKKVVLDVVLLIGFTIRVLKNPPLKIIFPIQETSSIRKRIAI